jgi:hypothetical protein
MPRNKPAFRRILMTAARVLSIQIGSEFGLAASSARDPSCRHSRRCERDYSDIGHVCRPISATLNRKAEQEWYREKKKNDVT